MNLMLEYDDTNEVLLQNVLNDETEHTVENSVHIAHVISKVRYIYMR